MVKRDKILDYFRRLNKHDILGPAYLFIGQDTALVTDIVKLINCPEGGSFCGQCWDCRKIQAASHPDFFLAAPEPLTITIERIRESQKFLAMKSFRLRRKTVLVKAADTLSPPAASAFLKTLEEPPQNSFIAVCTSKLDGVLPTIISRCRKIFLPAVPAAEDNAAASPLAADFLRGVNVSFTDRQEFSSFLWTLILLFRDHLMGAAGAMNNRLLKNREYEIIPHSYSREQAAGILECILKVYSAYQNVNENLALNLIRARLDARGNVLSR